MDKSTLLKNLDQVAHIAKVSKLKRMLSNPYKYISAILYRELLYKKTRQEKEVIGDTFFNKKMRLLLPSSTDIYLTKGKSHDSEIRLARYLINTLQKGDTFIDVGAHYGYFSMLAHEIIENKGSIHSFEASPKTFEILSKNLEDLSNVKINNKAVSDEEKDLIFYQFPNLYSEFNTLNIEQFQMEPWFNDYPPEEVSIKSIILDDYIQLYNIEPAVIKIDVEGAEAQVINGLESTLKNQSPIIIMEYVSDDRGNAAHKEAAQKLYSWNYDSFIIDKSGKLESIEDIPNYLGKLLLESDNIVFLRPESL